ncbi:MAG: DUF4124 domain-containing protein [Deltaproteobacteria bacterium]|nr:DUF4124 domain-containing protein [Deltaproteobacteria bacterium]
MKTRMLTALIILWGTPLCAQEIYKWEDKNGVVHYGDAPTAPAAAPMNTEDIPYSHTESSPSQSSSERTPRLRREMNEVRSEKEHYLPRALPRLDRPQASIARNGRLRLSGVIRTSGKSPCQAPAVEVTIVDELGSTDGNFATLAHPDVIMRGEEARFEDEYFTPVGGSFSWDAVPRCSTADGAVYGAHKRGTLKTGQSRIIRAKKLRR